MSREITGVLSTQIDGLRQQRKIHECADEDISLEMTKICTMLGLRENQYPTPAEGSFIMKWIKNKYSHYALGELLYAFELGMEGRLDIDDMKSYGAFSIQYLSDVMNSYRRLCDFLRKNNPPKPLELKSLPAPVLTLEDKRHEVYEFARTTTLPMGMLPLYIYNSLEELGLISTEPQDVENRLERAKKARLNQAFANAASGSHAGRQELKEIRKAVEDGSFNEREKVLIERLSKRIAIQDFIDTQKLNPPIKHDHTTKTALRAQGSKEAKKV